MVGWRHDLHTIRDLAYNPIKDENADKRTLQNLSQVFGLANWFRTFALKNQKTRQLNLGLTQKISEYSFVTSKQIHGNKIYKSYTIEQK